MIAFKAPVLLLLALPWLAFLLYFGYRQRRALTQIEGTISPRFRAPFTTHSHSSLLYHLLLLAGLGLLLVVAAAGPQVPGDLEITAQGGRVLLLVDASASMYAEDISEHQANWPLIEEADDRFEVARRIALSLVERLEGHRFAVATYSGRPALALPMTDDPALLQETLETIEPHNFYRRGGSSLAQALDLAVRFAADPTEDLQVVLLGDGELPYRDDVPSDEDFDAPLDALRELGVPVHGVTIGSWEGQSRVIWDFQDVLDGKEEKTELVNFTTRRVDRHFERIAEETDAFFTVAGIAGFEGLINAIESRPADAARVATDSELRDVSYIPLGLFLLGFLLENLFLGRRKPPEPPSFNLGNLGGGPPKPRRRPGVTAALLLALASLLFACRSPEKRAHRENEQGINDDRLGGHSRAWIHYERSRSYGIKPHIPTHNLARSHTLAGEHAEAHNIFQQALEISPEMVEAHYNDGVTLFLWGDAERDPKGCQLERTLDLWQNSRKRFQTSMALADQGSPLQADALVNQRYLAEQIQLVEELIENPPPECEEPPPNPGGGGGENEDEDDPNQGGGGGGGGGAGGGGGEDEEDPDQGGGGGGGEDEEDPDQGGGGGGGEDEEDPDQGGGGGEGEDEEDPNQGGGEGEDEEDPDGEGNNPPPSGGGTPPPGQDQEGPAQLSPEEQQLIAEALERLGGQRREEGKFHRRSEDEQFSQNSWKNPDRQILW